MDKDKKRAIGACCGIIGFSMIFSSIAFMIFGIPDVIGFSGMITGFILLLVGYKLDDSPLPQLSY